ARRPPDARAAAPPRTPPPRRDPARRRQAARQHPCRWRGAVRRPAPGQTPPSGNARQAQECLQPSKDGARVRAHRDRRPLPGRLCRGPRRRNRRHCDRRPAPGRDLVRRPRHHHPTSLVGQRLALPLTPVARDLHRTRDHALPDPPLPTPDERQDRTLPPHPRRRLGLRPRLHLRDRTTRCPGSMDPRVQPPPPPHRLREQATDHPIDQPVRSVHLAPPGGSRRWRAGRAGATPSSMTNDLGAPAPSRGRLLAARAVAVVAALFWGVLFFGLVDLATVVLQDERFARHYLLEAGWGLLYTGLVMLPLLVWAVRPRATVLLQGVLAAGAFGQLLPALGLAASALVPAALARQDLRPARVTARAVHPALAGLALVGVGGAVAYAVAVLRAAGAGEPDDETWGLQHLPMQAGLALALAGCALAVTVARAGGTTRWRAGVVPPALVAVSLSACCGPLPVPLR